MQPRPPAHDPVGTPPPGSSLRPSGPAPPETIRFTVEPFTTVVQGWAYRTEPTILVARRVPAAEANPSPALPFTVPSAQASVACLNAKDGEAGSVYAFRKTGRHWEVIFACGRAFRLRNTLGARYLDYLLHNPNEPLHAFDLEIEVQPEKGEARVRGPLQPESDAQAMREYRLELCRLQMETALAAGEPEKIARLEGEMDALKSALKGASVADTGERAFDNVRKALRVVQEQLRRGGSEEQAFAEHLRTHLSVGFECLYTQPLGRIWG